MNAEPFFDTSILIYAVSHNGPRKLVSEQLLARGGTVSVQVLNEFVAVARGKFAMPWADVLEALSAMRTLCGDPVAITVAVHELGLEIAERYKFHIYDSLIVAAALRTGCTRLYTEDLRHGQTIGSLTIHNPFLTKSRTE
jgi:predicted nucleic acid-binding protein